MTHRGPFQPLLFCDSVILWFCNSCSPQHPGLQRRLPCASWHNKNKIAQCYGWRKLYFLAVGCNRRVPGASKIHIYPNMTGEGHEGKELKNVSGHQPTKDNNLLSSDPPFLCLGEEFVSIYKVRATSASWRDVYFSPTAWMPWHERREFWKGLHKVAESKAFGDHSFGFWCESHYAVYG